MGSWGEALVGEYLRGHGYVLLASGWHCRYGEIDLIAVDDKFIAFTEVKLRRNDHFAAAREFVDGKKQRKLRITAELYLTEHPTELQPRFDVAEVYAPEGLATVTPQIVYIEDAF